MAKTGELLDVKSASVEVSPLAAFHRQRKADSRERLLAAALAQFSERGYAPVSIEDIATAAGVSRMTFYRHFRGKGDIAGTMFALNVHKAEPQLLKIRDIGWAKKGDVHRWLADLFAMDRRNRNILRVFIQASAIEPEFNPQAHQQIAAWIADLGQAIPAFAMDSENPQDRRRWLEAWLLIYEILDQSNHAALDSGIAADPLVLEILTDRFLSFVCQSAAT